MSGRGSERGWGSVWSSQPGLLSHLQPLSVCYTQTHTHAVHILSLSLSVTHTPDDNLMTRQQHTTACHFCIHSITVLLITCKLISRCPQVTSITLTTKSTTLLHFLAITTIIQKRVTDFTSYTSKRAFPSIQAWRLSFGSTFYQMFKQMAKMGAYLLIWNYPPEPIFPTSHITYSFLIMMFWFYVLWGRNFVHLFNVMSAEKTAICFSIY